jgi:hypothetical protein
VGERQNQPFQLSFDVSQKVDLQGSRVTSDGGLILVGDSRWGRHDYVPSPSAQPKKNSALEPLEGCRVGGIGSYKGNSHPDE